ncbi:MAG: DinB family protein, partial [Pyrinomonadaceae bacterium]|nr:DinB family protein [Pyrinomonadaceae bacterium]
MQTEAWLRGPLDGIDPLLMPAAHALVQAATDIEQAAQNLTVQELWSRPGGAASVGFHLRHVAGSIDRLFTYARGKQLTAEQHQALALEAIPGEAPAEANALTRE